MNIPDRSVQRPRKLRGHRKSRGGCLRCKAKKIKCSESRPACSNCVKSQTPCRFPLDPGVVGTAHPWTPHPNTQRLSVVPSTFSHDDLRAFHHVLTVAYPRLPLGTERAWKNDIPAMSHEVTHTKIQQSILQSADQRSSPFACTVCWLWDGRISHLARV